MQRTEQNNHFVQKTGPQDQLLLQMFVQTTWLGRSVHPSQPNRVASNKWDIQTKGTPASHVKFFSQQTMGLHTVWVVGNIAKTFFFEYLI